MTSFGETADKNAFFTGKPMVDELGYSFLFRNYNPNQGKWTTTDPLGYPDGWNNLAYVNNGVSYSFDLHGLSLWDDIGGIASQLKRKYNICTDKILYYGYSAGSQASNLFAEWRPGSCRAWVSHACGVFYEPGSRMKDTPGLVTCGDADQVRYIISRNFAGLL